jgi:gamma-glutamylcyclotransferase
MLYAAYGSNLHPARLRERLSSATLLGKATVAGKALRFHKRGHDGSGKCNIIAAGGEICVAVYEIAAPQKPKLDEIEGVGYRIETLHVADYGECFTYVATNTHIDESLKPFSWYKELVIAGCENLQFPRHYIEQIEAVESWEDPDRKRHAEHMMIVRRATNGA